jgi:SNF2 family DNA or RNA helicase
LRGLMAQFILHRTAEDVGLKIPDLETVEHVFELSEGQQKAYHELRDDAWTALNDPNGDHGIHLFSVYAQMRLLTLEPSLYRRTDTGPSYSSKLTFNPRFQEAARIAAEAHQTRWQTRLLHGRGELERRGCIGLKEETPRARYV